MIRIRTPSRLHFGLLALPSKESDWLNQEGKPTLARRHFGGVGLMIDKPGIELTVDFADTFSAEGPLAERALHFARTYRDCLSMRECFRVRVVSAAPEHMGLGTGTQLGLAVARAIAELTNQPEREAHQLAQYIGRGARSAIGVHGFGQGGFLVEGGKTSEKAISPLIGRYNFPWSVCLIFPPHLQGIHGNREREAFADLQAGAVDDRLTETMSRIVLLGLLPALLEENLSQFGEALYDYNRRAGEMFQKVQRGVYADPWIDDTIKTLRDMHIQGVGQSSWGPVVFAIVSGVQAFGLGDMIQKKKKFKPEQVVFAAPCNRGMTLSTE